MVRLKNLFLCLLLTTIGVYSNAQKGNNSSDEVLTGFKQMAALDRLPFLYPNGTKKARSICYDASGGNDDGYFRSTFNRYMDKNGELVVFDADGPGCLYRQQMNIWMSSGIGRMSKTVRIKYYLDNNPTPIINANVHDFFNGLYPPVTAPFAFMRSSQQFGIIYYPFSFNAHLKVTLSDTLITRYVASNFDPDCNWYQYDYLSYPQNVKVNPSFRRDEVAEALVRKQWDNLGLDPKSKEGNLSKEKHISIENGKTETIFDLDGQASIASIELNMAPFDSATFYHSQIRITWDDNEKPAIDMPISYFFGGGGVKDGKWNASLATLLYGFDQQKQNMFCYWPMPFWKHATIQIINNSGEKISSLNYKISYNPASVYNYQKEKSCYFMAKLTCDTSAGGFTRTNFTKPYMNAFQEEGSGEVIACNLWSGNYFEDGDEFTYLDDSHTPQIHGSGTEDDFDQGWSGAPYQRPLWGSMISGMKGVYRLHLDDPYIFYKGIDMRFELTASHYRGLHPRPRKGTKDDVIETEFVVWYYLSPLGKRLSLTDSIDIGNSNDEKAHDFSIKGQTQKYKLTQCYDSYESADDYGLSTDDGSGFNQYCSFKARLDANNHGVRLRNKISRTDNGIQVANVYVDGKKLPQPWSIFTYSEMPRRGKRSFDGWYESEYEIPAAYTANKKSVNIKIEYVKALKNELNSFRYWVYCYDIL